MNPKKITAYLYILSGLFLIIFFGGKLLIQLLGVLAGVLMVRHGAMMLSVGSMFQSYFRTFTYDKQRW